MADLNETLATIELIGDKMWITGDGVETREMYLPDCTSNQLIAFLHSALDYAMEDLATERPWRKRI